MSSSDRFRLCMMSDPLVSPMCASLWEELSWAGYVHEYGTEGNINEITRIVLSLVGTTQGGLGKGELGKGGDSIPAWL